MDEPMIEAALFEGMFVRAMRPDDELRSQLRAIGFDVARLEHRYPMNVWRRALDAARRRFFPDIPEEGGLRALGKRFIEGYFETIVGKAIAVPLKLVSPDHVIQHIPRMWRAGRPDVQMEVKKEGARRWRLHFQDRYSLPGFVAGVVEGASQRTTRRQGVTAEIENLTDEGFDIVVWW